MPTLMLADGRTAIDLRGFLQRLIHSGEGEARLVSKGGVLAVYGCTSAPHGLGDAVVLVMRGFALAETPEVAVDTTVQARALVDRLARATGDDRELDVPPFETIVPWAGVLPPVSGWEARGAIDADSLREVARQGIERVAELLPEQPGEAVVRRVRGEVWGAEIAPGIPAAAAFAAEVMGFLGEEPVRVARSRAWTRLSSEHGHVLIR